MFTETFWKIQPGGTGLPADVVDLWRVELDQPAASVDRLAGWLSPAEQARARRFHFEKDQRRYRVAHAALRAILGRYLGLEPQAIVFETGPRGKPSLAQAEQAGLYFNLSHSNEMALVAVARQPETGVDLEYVRPITDLNGLVKQNLSAAEQRQLWTLPAPLRLTGFFNAWTRKEAYIKALGEGLHHPLGQFDVSLSPGEPARLIQVGGSRDEAAAWQLQALDLGANYVGAVAVKNPGLTVRYWRWEWRERDLCHLNSTPTEPELTRTPPAPYR